MNHICVIGQLQDNALEMRYPLEIWWRSQEACCVEACREWVRQGGQGEPTVVSVELDAAHPDRMRTVRVVAKPESDVL